jgi:hypothetical protein
VTDEAPHSSGPPNSSDHRPTPIDPYVAVESSWDYPAFAREFPRTPDLDELVAAFTRGDFRTVRERAPKLAASTTNERVKKAAMLLRERIEPDPTAKFLFVFAAALLVFLTCWWVAHDGPEGASTPKAHEQGSAVSPKTPPQ